MDRLRDAQNQSHGMEVANCGEVDIGMRRASGFYELYEQVLNKEVELEERPVSGSDSGSDMGTAFKLGGRKRGGKAKAKKKGKAKVSERAEHVRTGAEKQLRESQAGMSYGQVDSKWTWGVDLNSQDIWEMVQGADKNLQIPHSGYDADLRTGRLRSSSPIPSPNAIEDQDEPGILFDELTSDQSIPELLPHQISLAFAYPILNYTAAGESHSGLQPPPISGSEYMSNSDRERAFIRQGKQAMQGEINSPDRPSTSDSHPIIPKGSPPHRPWLGPPPHGYVRLPTHNPVVLAKDIIQMRVASPPGEARCTRSEPKIPSELRSKPEPEPGPRSFFLPTNLNQMDFTDHGLDSDIQMDVASSNGSHSDLDEMGMRPADTQTGVHGLVAPDLQDESDEEIDVGDLGRDNVELSMRDEDTEPGTYGLVAPAPGSSSNSDEEIPVGNLGLDSQSESVTVAVK